MSYWSDNHRTLYNHDCRSMPELPDESVQVCITSPPYFGLRKYKAPVLIFGGDKDCQHEWGETIVKHHTGSNAGKVQMTNRLGESNNNLFSNQGQCSLCGAWRGQLGLEPSPELYIQHIVEICREVKRVLRDDGIFWLNIDDTRVSQPAGNKQPNKFMSEVHQSARDDANDPKRSVRLKKHQTVKEKELYLIPERLAIRLQEDGWYVRSVIAWVKQSVMPESVKDRPTDAYETVLMLTKSPRYYYDAEAVREGAVRDWNEAHGSILGQTDWIEDATGHKRGGDKIPKVDTTTRNLRNWWLINPQPSRLKHYAMYPEKLVEPCIKASTPEVGCCPQCGKAWERVTKSNRINRPDLPKDDPRYRPNTYRGVYADVYGDSSFAGDSKYTETKTLGWKAGCKCGLPQSENVPSLVLDMFGGSGTTALVATKFGRRSVTYELSEQYCKIFIRRNLQGGLI